MGLIDKHTQKTKYLPVRELPLIVIKVTLKREKCLLSSKDLLYGDRTIFVDSWSSITPTDSFNLLTYLVASSSILGCRGVAKRWALASLFTSLNKYGL